MSDIGYDAEPDPRGEFEEHDEPEERGERYGFGVCARGNCDEPCGPNGGCVR